MNDATSQFILVLCALMATFLSGVLTWAAMRNHFWRKTTRPIVVASAVLFFGLAVEFTKRVLIFVFPVDSPAYNLVARGGVVADVVNILLLVGMVVWFYVAVLAYPDTRRKP